jgi:tetratricopeptide (TPR) repeat protein
VTWRCALALAAVALGACSSSADERLERARAITASGTPRQAAEAWNAVLAVVEHTRGSDARHKRVEALSELGDLAYLKLSDPRGAAAAYRRLITEDPSSEAAWAARSKLADIAEHHLHDEAEAIAQRKALAASGRPGADGFAYQAARGYFTQGDMEQCRRDCRELVQRWPRGEFADDALLLIGAAYQFESKHAEAIAAYAEVMKRFAGTEAWARAQFQTARSLSALGRHDEALQGLLLALPTYPDPQEVQAEIAREREAVASIKNAKPEWQGGGEHEAHGE